MSNAIIRRAGGNIKLTNVSGNSFVIGRRTEVKDQEITLDYSILNKAPEELSNNVIRVKDVLNSALGQRSVAVSDVANIERSLNSLISKSIEPQAKQEESLKADLKKGISNIMMTVGDVLPHSQPPLEEPIKRIHSAVDSLY
jgi:hypothetical protein